MKCPHCEYEHGYCYELSVTIKGNEGDFFESPIMMTRTNPDTYYYTKQESYLYACPKCQKTFIDFKNFY